MTASDGGRGPDRPSDTAIRAIAALGLPAVTSSGIPADFRADRTLVVGVELIRQLRRRRTQLALGFMVALPFMLVLAFSVGGAGGTGGTSFVALAGSGAANFAVVTIFFSAGFLVLVVVSLFFGDTIAAEASWSSLRYLLAMPVPRLRLLRQKFLVAALLSVAAVTVLSATAYLVGLVAYGPSPLATPIGDDFGTRDGLLRLGVVIGYVAIQLSWVAGLAFLLSVLTDAPLGAVGGAVLVAIVSQILDQIEALGQVRLWLPTHYGPSWSGALVDPIRWDDMVRGVFTGLAYAFILVLLAFLRFWRKDITS